MKLPMFKQREYWVNGVLMGLLLLVPLIATRLDEPFIVTLATKLAILAMAGVGLNLALGYGGLISLGHAVFFGLGGYAAGVLASHAQNYEPLFTWPLTIDGTTSMWVIWLVAIAVSMLAAMFIGALSLRTRGVYFIMITLAFAQMLYYFAISWPAYGGEDGLSLYVRNQFFGLNTLQPLTFFLICFVWLGVSLWFSARLVGSRFGLALQSVRQNEERVISVGIKPFNLRLVAFVLSAAITAVAGALYADLNRFVSPSMLSWHMSGEIMVFVILGGVGRLFGPLAGAALYILLEHFLGGVMAYWQLLLGVLLLLVVLYSPGGLMGWLAGERAHE